MMSRSLALSALCLMGGCKAPPEAPQELDELSAFLFANFETDEEGLLEAGMYNMQDFFGGVDMTAGDADRAYSLDNLTEEDLAGVDYPDGVDPADCLAIGLVASSLYSPAQHGKVIILEDQTVVEPYSQEKYKRIFLDPTDPSCFPGQACDLLRTNNKIIKDSLDIEYQMIKDFRWVELAMEGEGLGQWGVLARTWIEAPGVAEDGDSIDQSYSIDVFLPVGSGAYRYMALWSESQTSFDDPDTVLTLTRVGISAIFEATDEWLEENL